MRIVLFYHSLISDWNNGNAHFLRGIVTELLERGHAVEVYESRDGWSLQHLLETGGGRAVREFYRSYPGLRSRFYRLETLDLDRVLEGADLVIVHEWNEPDLVRRIGRHRRLNTACKALFHDTHHRSVSRPEVMSGLGLRDYDGVLAFGQVIRDIYLNNRWAREAWVWHEAADTRKFRPLRRDLEEGDLVWIGNWGDEERSTEIAEFLIEPSRELKLKTTVHGVRYPDEARRRLEAAGIRYRGWLANFAVPETFGRYRVTVHIPRGPYTRMLPGIPTIRPFEALTCGIPLICAPWQDTEGLFTPGKDYLIAENGRQMKAHLVTLLNEPEYACQLVEHGRRTVLRRHTCAHRVDELMTICRQLGMDTQTPQTASLALSERIK